MKKSAVNWSEWGEDRRWRIPVLKCIADIVSVTPFTSGNWLPTSSQSPHNSPKADIHPPTPTALKWWQYVDRERENRMPFYHVPNIQPESHIISRQFWQLDRDVINIHKYFVRITRMLCVSIDLSPSIPHKFDYDTRVMLQLVVVGQSLNNNKLCKMASTRMKYLLSN